MKRIFLNLSLLVIIAFTVVSCDDDKVVTQADLPQTSSQFLNTYFKDVGISHIEKDSEGYSVKLSNRIEVDFDLAGEWTEVDGEDGVTIPSGFILQPIVNYVNENYASDNFNGIEKITTGYDVDLLNSNTDLIFDTEGNFIREDH